MDNWRWWTAKPSRALLGLVILVVITTGAAFFVTTVLLPALSALVGIIIVLAIIRFALTGNVIRDNGRH